MSEISFLFEIGAILVSVVILYLLFKLLKSLTMLLIHSVGALILLFLINSVLGFNIAINAFSILAVALGGLPGLILVLILHVLGLAF